MYYTFGLKDLRCTKLQKFAWNGSGQVRDFKIQQLLPLKLVLIVLLPSLLFTRSCNFTEKVCKCGKPSISRKIINGTVVEPHSLPFLVAIYLMLENGRRIFCTGSLITPSFVLTGKFSKTLVFQSLRRVRTQLYIEQECFALISLL